MMSMVAPAVRVRAWHKGALKAAVRASHSVEATARVWCGVQTRFERSSLAYDAQVCLANDLCQRIRLLTVVMEHYILACGSAARAWYTPLCALPSGYTLRCGTCRRRSALRRPHLGLGSKGRVMGAQCLKTATMHNAPNVAAADALCSVIAGGWGVTGNNIRGNGDSAEFGQHITALVTACA